MFFYYSSYYVSMLVSVTAPEPQSTGFIFVRIRGGFHEIRNSVRILCVDYCLLSIIYIFFLAKEFHFCRFLMLLQSRGFSMLHLSFLRSYLPQAVKESGMSKTAPGKGSDNMIIIC